MSTDIIVDIVPIPCQEEFSIKEAAFEEHTYRGIKLSELQQKAISGVGGLTKDSPLISKSKKYNELVNWAFETDGFKDFFLSHNSVVSYEMVAESFGGEFADKLFTLSFPHGIPQFLVFDNWLMDTNCQFTASFTAEGQEYTFSIPDDMNEWCNGVCGDKLYFYDWSDSGLFFSAGLFQQFVDDGILCRKALLLDDGDAYWYAENWGSWSLAYQSCNYIMKTLINLGYMREYRLRTKDKYPAFSLWSDRDDKSFGFAILDQKYKKDKLLVEKINCLLSEVADEREACNGNIDDETDINSADYSDYLPSPKSSGALSDSSGEPDLYNATFYYLQDENDKVYLSPTKGRFGGHKKLKIYGRLDCPSAARYLAKGQYAKQRVFFSDEETAVAAGYRPCGVCMPEAYKKWKAQNEKKS